MMKLGNDSPLVSNDFGQKSLYPFTGKLNNDDKLTLKFLDEKNDYEVFNTFKTINIINDRDESYIPVIQTLTNGTMDFRNFTNKSFSIDMFKQILIEKSVDEIKYRVKKCFSVPDNIINMIYDHGVLRIKYFDNILDKEINSIIGDNDLFIKIESFERSYENGDGTGFLIYFIRKYDFIQFREYANKCREKNRIEVEKYYEENKEKNALIEEERNKKEFEEYERLKQKFEK